MEGKSCLKIRPNANHFFRKLAIFRVFDLFLTLFDPFHDFPQTSQNDEIYPLRTPIPDEVFFDGF